MSVIHFLNVKEGDCIWIKHNSGHSTMLDVCNASKIEENREKIVENVLGNYNRKNYPVNPVEYLKEYGEDDIFRFILTHPDMDHMDGIKSIFNEFSVINFWDTKNTKYMDKDSDWGRYNKEDWEFYQSIRKSNSNPKSLNLYAGAVGQYFNKSKDEEMRTETGYMFWHRLYNW